MFLPYSDTFTRDFRSIHPATSPARRHSTGEGISFSGSTTRLPGARGSRVHLATDDENVLYVNTKSLVDGDVKRYRPGETKLRSK